ncbi:trans-1,2-dihydrobenzene-1,2-diol dehydrogenase-like [Mytilus galloprovincialis]|uniref:trans-1,2-dihydrobenzene-1,2-diol dehydrogenase-like n=1 Tax=Mytilus galloprovincialis TaxID=29158 RepID=UPI003F7C1700
MALKWGICSTGKICSDFCSALKNMPSENHQIAAVVSRSQENAQKFATTFDIPNVYSSYEKFAADADINIVYIGSAYTEHVRLSIQMLNAGKHVLCEKPLADTLEDVKLVHKVAQEKQLFFMEAVWSRCFPLYHRIKEEITSKNMGEAQMVSARFFLNFDYCERIKTQIRAGMLLDAGIYTVQFACMVYGEYPVSVKAVGEVVESGHDIDGCIILSYSEGQKACLIYSSKVKSDINCASIIGTNGSIEMNNHFWCPDEVIFPTGKDTNEIPVGPVPFNYPNSGGLCYEAEEVRKCINNGKTEYAHYSHKDSEMVHRIMEDVAKQIGRKLPN